MRRGAIWSDRPTPFARFTFVAVDRIKDMIVTGGENTLSKHPAVLACAVIAVPDEQWGERVHAVVVCRPGHTATAGELRDFCRDRIAAYKAPRTVDFVDALPLAGAGKILERELRVTHWSYRDRQVG